MARLALSVGLGIVGGLLAVATAGVATPAIFGLGFSIGSVVGGIAGSLLFPPGGAVGPRLNDLQISSSAPGNPIPFGFGQYRIGGQIIWAQAIQEHKKNQSAKGGPTTTTYDYTCTFAVSFGFGPGQIMQLWGDSDCIYDTTGTQQVGTLQNSQGETVSLSVTLYPGDENQMPDPTIVSIQGAKQTPAYRGQILAVFDNMDLSNFGNRIPNMRGLVNYGDGAANHPAVALASSDQFPLIDEINRVYYVFSASRDHVSKYSLVDNSAIFLDMVCPWPTGAIVDINSPVATVKGGVDPDGFLWIFIINGDGGGNYPLCKVNPNTMQLIHVNVLAGGLDHPEACSGCYSPGDGNTYMYVHMSGGFDGLIKWCMNNNQQVGPFLGFQLHFPETLPHVTFDETEYPVIDGAAGNCYSYLASSFYGKWYIWSQAGFPVFEKAGVTGVGEGMAVAMIANPQNNTLIVTTDTGCIHLIDAVGWTILSTYGNTDTSNTWPGANQPVVVTYLIKDTNGNVQECTVGGFTGAYQPGMFPVGTPGQIWNPDLNGVTQDGSVRWTNLGGFPFVNGTSSGGNFNAKAVMCGFNGHVQNGIFFTQDSGVSSNSGQCTMRRAADLVAVDNFDFFTNYVGTGPQTILGAWQWDSIYGSIICGGIANGMPAAIVERAYVARNGSAGVGVDVILADFAGRMGLTAADYDFSAVSDLTCLGYVITNPQSAAQCISPLCQAYLFDLVETDFVIKAVKRGQPSTWTIPENDLGLQEDKRKLLETMNAYTDTPKDVVITYVDPALDYQQGTQRRKRHKKTIKSINETIINLPFVFGPTDAIQLADKLIWLAELERQTFDFNVWKSLYMLMDPTDVITFSYEGLQFIARVIKNSIGQNYAVEISGVNQNATAYLSTISGVGQPGFIKGGVAAFGPTILFLLDTTLMQDKDQSPIGQSGIYFAFASPVVGNPGAVLYESSDQQNWASVSMESDHIAYGFSTNALGVPASPWCWDHVNTLTLFFADTGVTLSSMSDLNIYNGANGVLVGKELIQFKTAVHNANGSWTLSNLLRGRRGTEWACAGHVVSEACFFPQVQGGLHRLAMNANLIGIIQYFKAITLGGDLNSGPSNPLTLAGNDVKPYAPVDVAGTKDGSGNLVIQWQRRTRIGAGANIAGTWPISEETESYDVVITDSLGVVKRTFSNITPNAGPNWSSPDFPHVAYTAAQQTTDFGGVQTTYYFQVFQNSALTFTDGTHRGFETRCVLPLALSATSPAAETFIYH
jgi:hypothetical protein